MDLRHQRFEKLIEPAQATTATRIRDLGDGLVLRRATPQDVPALVAFNKVALADPPDFGPEIYASNWTRELAGGEHPRTGAEDFLIVHDTRRRRIASSCCLLAHRLVYGGVEIDVGQPELIATHPDYRGQGLVRLQLEELHQRSERRGDVLQLISGIPWFYRQFGYEYAIEHGRGGKLLASQLPEPGADGEGFVARAARPEDADFLDACYERGAARSRLHCLRSMEQWRFDLTRRGDDTMGGRLVSVIQGATGGPVGMLVTYPAIIFGVFHVTALELAEDVSWQHVAPAVLAFIAETARALARRDGREFESVMFALGSHHPFLEAASLQADPNRYALYIRVPDLPGFLQRVAPVLDAHLANSDCAGHTGSLRLGFFRDGLRLEWRDGRLVRAESWQPIPEDGGDATFPGLSFLSLLFGLRSFDQLREAFPDCTAAEHDIAALVAALFPPQASGLWLTY